MNKALALVFGLILVFSLSASVSAQSLNAQIPEKNGDYPDPQHPGLRVRVFVHQPKPQRPSQSPTPTPSLVCQEDPNSDTIVPPAGWKLPSSWTYTLNPSSVPLSVGATNLAAIAANAFNEWMTATSSVKITRAAPDTTINNAKYDRKNIITWGRTSGSALAVTYTWYDKSTGLAVETDTIFNLKFPWYWNAADNKCTSPNAYDAQDILTHELGHWMGLNDVYSDLYINNTMYGYGSKGEVKKDTLTAGDVEGILNIYGK